ncbi:MAG: MinD/ParA family protein [Planctomycetes bacterium]|nr:MinD/ParA family protein [Planctomycetota bacterium]
MSNVLRLVIVDPNDSSREHLKAMLLSMEIVWLEAECSRYEFFADVVGQTHPDLGIVNVDSDTRKAIQLIENLRASSPECAILIVSDSSDGQLILQAIRAGAKEFLSAPIKVEDLSSALERISIVRFGRGEGKSRGCNVIAVAGTTGGVGSTSVAVNLANFLASTAANSVALIDLDLALGDADVLLDTIPDYTIVDVAQNVARLDINLLKRSLTKHVSGLYLLPRPIQLQDSQLITPDDLQRVFSLLRATFSHLVIDTSKGYSPLDMVAISSATNVLLLTQLDLPCLRNALRLLMSFDEIEGLKEKVKVIINRVGLDDGQISLKKAQETIGREIFWQLPNDYRTMVEARNNGVPLLEQAPRSALTQSIMGLSNALSGSSGTESETAESPSKSWLRFWPAKAKSK